MPVPTRLLIAATLLLGACRGESDPRVIVRQQIDAAIAAARDRDVGDVFDDVSSDFVGPDGLGQRETRRYVTGQLLRPGWMTVFAPRVDVEPPDEAGIVRARAQIVLVRGRPVEKLEDVLPQQARRFEVRTESRLVDGAWQFVRADARRGAFATP